MKCKEVEDEKVPGIWGIVPEMLKAGGKVMVEWMVKMFNLVWREGVVPVDWNKYFELNTRGAAAPTRNTCSLRPLLAHDR